MDELWLVSLCLTFLAFVVILLSLRKTDSENERLAKDKERSAAPVFVSAQPAARFMEMTPEDIDKTLERLGAVLGAEPEKQQPTRHHEQKKQSGNDDRSGSGSQARAVANKALPMPRSDLVNQDFAIEDWEFDEEETHALQCEGTEKQYYHLYWDEESSHNRFSYSVVGKADLTRRKQMYNTDTREREMSCPKCLQLGSNVQYLPHSNEQHAINQLARLQIDNVCGNYSTPQITTAMSKSPQPARGDKKVDKEFNLSPNTDRPVSLESEKHISSWTDKDKDDYGKFCCEEFRVINYQLQTSHGDSDSESSSVDSCLPPSPRLRRCSPAPFSFSHSLEGEDSSSLDDISPSPTNSKESRFSSCDESSSSDISLLSFLSDLSLSESSFDSADSRDARNSTLVARTKTGLVKTVTKPDKTLWPSLLADSSAKLNSREEVAESGIQSNFTEPDRKHYFPRGRKTNVHSCSVSLEESLTGLQTLQSMTFHSGEPNNTFMLHNMGNAGQRTCSEYSVKWRLEKLNGRKEVRDDISSVLKFPCENVHHQQEGTFWETSPGQELWPDFTQELEAVEHPPVTSSTRNIMEQIEQAVQETPNHNKERSDYIRVRRAPPAPRLETAPRDDLPQSRTMHSSD